MCVLTPGPEKHRLVERLPRGDTLASLEVTGTDMCHVAKTTCDVSGQFSSVIEIYLGKCLSSTTNSFDALDYSALQVVS